ncbi:MAG: YIP1 family protein [Methanomassiliicoccales archaeon]
MVEVITIVGFLVAWLVSTIVIYFVTKLFGQTESFGKAIMAALIGTVIYIIAYFLIGNGLLAAIVAGIVWLMALRSLYKIDWGKALIIAIIVWIVAIVIGIFLPTLPGPF